ncbi:MAG: HD domain-containing protein [Chloroflexi bacterium]|nr:MAG: HD domain-containing protein [Chloroflexota bacterium]
MSALYRIRQGTQALLAFTQTVNLQLVQQYLSSEQYMLFLTMRHSEQLHAVQVLNTVLEQEEQTPQDLAVAALLHDVGKARYRIYIWQKTIAVLAKRFLPKLYERWSEDVAPHQWWRRPFIIKAHHPRWGAEMLAETNASERAIWLVAHHQDNADDWKEHPDYHLLLRLQKADSAH